MASILVVNGSARKNSNSRALSAKVADEAARAGHTVKTVEIGTAAIHPCIGCDTCRDKAPGHCVFTDDMTPLYADVQAADIVIYAGPIYYFTVNAQTKLFLDRLYALGDKAYAGKQVGAVFAFEGEDPMDSGCVNAIRMFQDICAYTKARWIGAVYGSVWKQGEAADNAALLRKAEEYGRELGQG